MSLSDRFYRRAFFQTLSALQCGTLIVDDCAGSHSFGDDSSGLVARVRVNSQRFYRSAVLGGSLGVAEAYLDSMWDCDDLVALIRIAARNERALAAMEGGAARLLAPIRRAAHKLSHNSRRGSKRNIAAHYDLSNDFFAAFLDPTMTYSCGIFEKSSASMEEASIAKYERICRMLELTPDDHVLEIGSGWGGFSIHAASRFGCRVTTTTISEAQFEYAREQIRRRRLEDRVSLLNVDYRDLVGRFDKLVSIEMIEAVGHEYLPTFFSKCDQLLKPGGLLALQAITIPDQRYERYRRSVDFIQRYIFPGGCLPSLGSLVRANSAVSEMQLVALDDFGSHYARTLANWRERLQYNTARIRQLGMPTRLIRAWDYYLCYCEGGFREQKIGVAQIKFRKPRYSRGDQTAG